MWGQDADMKVASIKGHYCSRGCSTSVGIIFNKRKREASRRDLTDRIDKSVCKCLSVCEYTLLLIKISLTVNMIYDIRKLCFQ